MYNSDIPSRAELPTTAQLIKSTIIAFIAAMVLLVTVVLPSEYAVDPTGVGRAMGLTQMGDIKLQLAEEAEADRLRDQQQQPTVTAPKPDQESSLIGNILSGVSGLFISSAQAEEVAATRKDEMTVTLTPGEGTEIKLTMNQGAKVSFSWSVEAGAVNFDMHGDSSGQEISYEKGRSVPKAEGVLEAAFDGNHGWFWRNRGEADVKLTLKTDGAYSDIKQMK